MSPNFKSKGGSMSFWSDSTPWTKRLVIIGVVVIVVASMITGNFELLVGLFGGK